MLYAAPVLAMMYWASERQRARGIIAIGLVGVLLALVFAITMRTWRRFFLAQMPLSLLAVLFVAYTFTYHMPPGRTAALIVLLASWEQVLGYLQLPQGRLIVGALTGWCVTYVGLATGVGDTLIFVRPVVVLCRLAVYAMLPATAYAATDSAQLIDGLALNPMAGSLFFVGGKLLEQRRELHGSRVNKTPYHAHRSGSEEVHVFVLGESSRRDSWSAYGYRRPTTPYVDRIKNEAILLQHAKADANLTEWAVPIMLTGLGPDEYSPDKVHGNLLDLAHEAGYSTAWLVNNNVAISNSVGVDPDKLVQPTDLNGNINGRHTLDEALLSAYHEELIRSGSPRFIGIHLMGSHWEYFARYPKRFQIFTTPSGFAMVTLASVFAVDSKTATAVMDQYDDSLLYTDWFLQQVIEGARALKVPVTVTYYPDHGELLQELDGAAGHGAPVYSPHEFAVPAFIWINDAYRRLHPDLVRALQGNATLEVRSHNLLPTLAQLMGIRWSGADPRRSLASNQYVPDRDMPYVAGGRLVKGDEEVDGPMPADLVPEHQSPKPHP